MDKTFKATVTDNLYIRPFGAESTGESDDFFEPGEEVDIVRSVYGEELNYKGESSDIWYVLDTGEFVWGGCITSEEDLPVPVEKRVIFTADDYGVVKSINEGVFEAIRKGPLNSVACFTNFGANGIDACKNIRDLEKVIKQSGRTVELGVHLTITSGSPVIGRDNASILCRDVDSKAYLKVVEMFTGVKAFNPNIQCDFHSVQKIWKNFQKVKKTKDKDKIETYLNQLENEMKAQMMVFLDPPDNGKPIPIKHLTSHHNSMFYHKEFFEILMEVAKGEWIPASIKNRVRGNMQFPIPIRSLNNVPEWKDYLFLRGRAFHPGDRGWHPKNWVNGPIKFMKNISRDMCKRADLRGVKSPGFLNSQHYGPLPMAVLKKHSFQKQVSKKKENYIKMLNQLRWESFESMEFLLHIRQFNGKNVYNDQWEYFVKEIKETKYGGIDYKGFDSRTAEYRSVTEKYQEKGLLKGIVFGTWDGLKVREGCVHYEP